MVACGLTAFEKLKLSWKIVCLIYRFESFIFETYLRFVCVIIMFSSFEHSNAYQIKKFQWGIVTCTFKFDFVLKARSSKKKVSIDLWNFGVLSDFFIMNFLNL